MSGMPSERKRLRDAKIRLKFLERKMAVREGEIIQLENFIKRARAKKPKDVSESKRITRDIWRFQNVISAKRDELKEFQSKMDELKRLWGDKLCS